MKIQDILSPGEQVLFEATQRRLVPGGKEWAPGKLYVMNDRIVLETQTLLGLRKSFEDLHYSDVESVVLNKNIRCRKTTRASHRVSW